MNLTLFSLLRDFFKDAEGVSVISNIQTTTVKILTSWSFFKGGSDDGLSVKRSLKSRGVLLGLMLYFLNGFVTTWVGFVLPLVAYNHFHFEVRQYGWLMVGVSGTATVSSFTMALLSKARCIANNKHGDWRVLLMSYTVMVFAIVISYLGGPSVSDMNATEM